MNKTAKFPPILMSSNDKKPYDPNITATTHLISNPLKKYNLMCGQLKCII